MKSQPDGSANFAAALRRNSVGLHQHGGTLTERCSRRGDVGDQRGVGQPVAVDLAQRPLPASLTQIGDVVEAEIYDGLTPVTMTL